MIHSTNFFSLLFVVNFYFFSVFDTAAAPDPGPSDSSLPLPWTPALFFRELPSCFLLFVCALGARACAARVCVCVCLGGVCVGVNASVCGREGVSVCVSAGIGSNPGVPFTHLLWNQQSGFQDPFPSTDVSLLPARPTPTLSLARPPSPYPISAEEAWFS